MSLRNESREIVFQDFLNQYLTPKEKKNQSVKSFHDFLTAQSQIQGLGLLLKCINQLQTQNINLEDIIAEVNQNIPLNFLYLFTVDTSKKMIHLQYSFPAKTKIKDQKKKSIQVNQSFLNLALNSENEPKLREGLCSFFDFTNDDLLFQKFSQNNQLKGFIFYSSHYNQIETNWNDFWKIILTSYFSSHDS